jgi:hypothetical protein
MADLKREPKSKNVEENTRVAGENKRNREDAQYVNSAWKRSRLPTSKEINEEISAMLTERAYKGKNNRSPLKRK